MSSLPETAFSHLGPLAVVRAPIQSDDPRRGECDLTGRVITILPDVADAVAWQTLGHEITHAVLWDAGAQHSLTDRQTEIVCDAVGTWFAAAVRAGWLRITTTD